MPAACIHLLLCQVLEGKCTCNRLVQEGRAVRASCSAGFRGPLLQQVHLSGLGLAAAQLVTDCFAVAFLLQTLEP